MERLEKTRAFLTEFIIVILFFTVSAVITLQLFVDANKKSNRSMSITQGCLKAEALVEEIKANIDTSEENVIEDYMTGSAGYTTGETKGYYYQYFDKYYDVTDQDDAYIYGYVKVNEENTGAGVIYNITVAFENNQESLSKIDFKIYDEEVQP